MMMTFLMCLISRSKNIISFILIGTYFLLSLLYSINKKKCTSFNINKCNQTSRFSQIIVVQSKATLCVCIYVVFVLNNN
jgi:hypothetical protein